jgi:uncharacterized protein YejL (UPF0352 family)
MSTKQMVENGKKSSADLKAALEADRKERAEACMKELDAVLKKYDCTIDATMQVQGNMAKAVPLVVAK